MLTNPKSPYNANYAIVECLIEIEQSKLLDLVGSVEDQLYFETMLSDFQQMLQEKKITKKVTASDVLKYYKKQAESNSDYFPYHAIKAQDNYKELSLKFIENGNKVLPLITRQQLCLFKSAHNCVKNKSVIYPEPFKEAYLLSKGE